MAITHTQKCDACFAILNGQEDSKRDAKKILRDCIEIKGQVISHDVDSSGYRVHTFISPTPDSDLAFCNIECLGTYIRVQKARWKRSMEREAKKSGTSRSVAPRPASAP